MVARATRMGLRDIEASARHNLGMALGFERRFEEARREETTAVRVFQEAGYIRMEAASRVALAQIERQAGREEAAVAEAERAVKVAEGAAPVRVYALALLADALLASGRAAEARERAAQATALLAELGSVESGESLVRAAEAETLHAVGEKAKAADVIRAARVRLLARADKIDDPELRASFLERVPDNARILALAAAWGVGG